MAEESSYGADNLSEADVDVDAELEARFSKALNEEELKERVKSLGLKEGTYTTIPPFNFKKKLTDDGRAVVFFHGQVIKGDVKGPASYRISEDKRNKIDRDGQDTGKEDIATKLYSQALSAFKEVYKRYPETNNELLEYLRDYSHKLYLMLSEDGRNIVVTISPVREI